MNLTQVRRRPRKIRFFFTDPFRLSWLTSFVAYLAISKNSVQTLLPSIAIEMKKMKNRVQTNTKIHIQTLYQFIFIWYFNMFSIFFFIDPTKFEFEWAAFAFWLFDITCKICATCLTKQSRFSFFCFHSVYAAKWYVFSHFISYSVILVSVSSIEWLYWGKCSWSLSKLSFAIGS